jgi:hypothetical protein
MSSIGITNLGAMTVAGSAAGTQSNAADTDEIKQNSANQKAVADRNVQSAKALGDVAETDLSSDRDADGREPFGVWRRPGRDDGGHEEGRPDSPRVPDAAGERGNSLDLEA